MNKLTIEEEKEVMEVILQWRRTVESSESAMKKIYKIFVTRKSSIRKTNG